MISQAWFWVFGVKRGQRMKRLAIYVPCRPAMARRCMCIAPETLPFEGIHHMKALHCQPVYQSRATCVDSCLKTSSLEWSSNQKREENSVYQMEGVTWWVFPHVLHRAGRLCLNLPKPLHEADQPLAPTQQWGAESTSNSCVTQLNRISPTSLTPTRILTVFTKQPGVTLYRNCWLAGWWPPLKDSSESSEQLFCRWPDPTSVQFGENVVFFSFCLCDPVIHR